MFSTFEPAGLQAVTAPAGLLDMFTDLEGFLVGFGSWALLITAVMVFIESGVLFPFLPGDSLIFTMGLLHLQLGISIWVLLPVVFVAAFLGDQVGYYLGHRFGRKLFSDDARVLKTEHLAKAEEFFDKYGGRSLVIARFVPIVRTYVPLAAGIAKYRYSKFIRWNAVGAAAWGLGVTTAGALLGSVPFVRGNLEVIIVLIVFVSILPMVFEFLAARRRNRREAEAKTRLDSDGE